MIYETVAFAVEPARRAEYVDVYRRALREADFPGYHGGKILSCVEDPARVMVVLEWDSVEAHASTRGTPAHTRFLAAIRPYWTAPAEQYHFLVEDL